MLKTLCAIVIGRCRKAPTQREYLMNKKLIFTCMVLGGLAALAIGAATASAANDPQLTTNTGTLVPVGTSDLKLTQIGTTGILNTSGTKLLECSTATGTGSVIKNSGSTVEGEITSVVIGGTGAPATGEPAPECTSSLGNFSVTPTLPWCLRSTPAMAEDEMQVVAGPCPGTGNVKFVIFGTTTGECQYEATSSIKLDFHTAPSDAQATIRSTQSGSGLKLIKGGFLCPTSVMLEGTRTLESEAGSPLLVS